MALSPFALPETDTPPWSWNPAATFQASFIAAQENQRAQREFEVAQELEQYLLPLKKQQTQLSLANMELQFERTKGELERQNILKNQEIQAVRNSNRGFNQGLRDAGNGVGGTNQQQAPQTPTRSYFNTQPVASAPSSNQNSGGMTLGSGITP